MRFMLMMHAPRGTGDWGIFKWTPESINAHMEHMHALNRDLIAAGEFVQGEGLTPPGEAKVVRAAKDGAPITDGVFPESKEFLAGFWIIEVDSAERAYEIAARASTAPGPDGSPLNMPLEVRQVMGGPPKD